MGGRFGCAVLGLVGLVLAGLGVAWLAKARTAQERLYCVNHLRQLGQFTDAHAQLNPGRPLFNDEAGRPAPTADQRAKLERQLAGGASVPAGTLPHPDLPPDRRLSWVVFLLPMPDGLDRAAGWDAPANQAAARTPLTGLRCFGKTPTTPPGSPAVTQYVGNGGVGADAPSLAWPEPATPPPRAGAFRYDAPTPLACFLDGTSSTVLFAETDHQLGPWLQGGPATVRPLDGPLPPVGPGGQFGGTHPGGGNFAFADHSVRFLSDRTAAGVLHGLFTLAGGASDPVPGE